MRVICCFAILLILGGGSGCQTSRKPFEARSLTGGPESFIAISSNQSDHVPANMNSGISLAETKVVLHQEQSQVQPLTIASDRELTLQDLENMALANSPVLAEAAARVEAAHGNWEQVGLPPNPVVGYSGQQLGSGGEAEQQGVFVGQEFVTGNKLELNRQVAAWGVQQAERDLDISRLRVLTDVRIGYYEVLVAQQRRDLAKELVEVSERAVQAAQALFKGEEVSEADPLRAKVEADTAQIVLQNAVNQHLEAWRRLAAVLSAPTMELRRVKDQPRTDDVNLSWQEELERLLRESPEVFAAIADLEAAQWAVERACAEVVPNVEVQAVVQDDRGTGSSNANLQITLPIPIWNRNQGGIKRAQGEAAAARQAVGRLALDLQARLAAAFQRYESARNQVEKYSRKDGILDNAQRTLDLIRSGYQAEEFGVLDLLTAQRTYFQTNLAYLESLRELWVAAAEIKGLLLRNSLSR